MTEVLSLMTEITQIHRKIMLNIGSSDKLCAESLTSGPVNKSNDDYSKTTQCINGNKLFTAENESNTGAFCLDVVSCHISN